MEFDEKEKMSSTSNNTIPKPQQQSLAEMAQDLRQPAHFSSSNSSSSSGSSSSARNHPQPQVSVPIASSVNNTVINQHNIIPAQPTPPITDTSQTQLVTAVWLDKIQAHAKNKVRQLRELISNIPSNTLLNGTVSSNTSDNTIHEQRINNKSVDVNEAETASSTAAAASNSCIDLTSVYPQNDPSTSSNSFVKVNNKNNNNNTNNLQCQRSYIRMQPQIVVDLTCDDVAGCSSDLNASNVESPKNQNNVAADSCSSSGHNNNSSSTSSTQESEDQHTLKSLSSPVIVKPESFGIHGMHNESDRHIESYDNHKVSQVVTMTANSVSESNELLPIPPVTTTTIQQLVTECPTPSSTSACIIVTTTSATVPLTLTISPPLSIDGVKSTPSPVSSTKSSLAAHSHSSSTTTTKSILRKQLLPTLETIKISLKNLTYNSLQMELGSFKCYRYHHQIQICLDRLKKSPIQTDTSDRLVSILTALCKVRQVPEIVSFFETNIYNNTLTIRPSENNNNGDNSDHTMCGVVEESGLVRAGKLTGDKLIAVDGYHLYGKRVQVVQDILQKRFSHIEESTRSRSNSVDSNHQITLVFLRLPVSVYDWEPGKSESKLIKNSINSTSSNSSSIVDISMNDISNSVQQHLSPQQSQTQVLLPVVSSRFDRMKVYAEYQTKLQSQQQIIQKAPSHLPVYENLTVITTSVPIATHITAATSDVIITTSPTTTATITTTSISSTTTAVTNKSSKMSATSTSLLPPSSSSSPSRPSTSSTAAASSELPSAGASESFQSVVKHDSTDDESLFQPPSSTTSFQAASSSSTPAATASTSTPSSIADSRPIEVAAKTTTVTNLKKVLSSNQLGKQKESTSSSGAVAKVKHQITASGIYSTKQPPIQEGESSSSSSSSSSTAVPTSRTVPTGANTALPTATIAKTAAISEPNNKSLSTATSTMPHAATHIASLEKINKAADFIEPLLISSSISSSYVPTSTTVTTTPSNSTVVVKSTINNTKNNSTKTAQKSAAVAKKSGVESSKTKKQKLSSSSSLLPSIDHKSMTSATAAPQQTASATSFSMSNESKDSNKLRQDLITDDNITATSMIPILHSTLLSTSSSTEATPSSSSSSSSSFPPSSSNSADAITVTPANKTSKKKRNADQISSSSSSISFKKKATHKLSKLLGDTKSSRSSSSSVAPTSNAAEMAAQTSTSTVKTNIYSVDDDDDEAWSDTDDKKYNDTYNDEEVTALIKKKKTKVVLSSSSSSSSSSSISPTVKRRKTSGTISTTTSPPLVSSSSSRLSSMANFQQQSFQQRRDVLMSKLIVKGQNCLIHVRPNKTSDMWHEAIVQGVIHKPYENDPDLLYQVEIKWILRNTLETIDVNPDLIEIADEMKKRGRKSH